MTEVLFSHEPAVRLGAFAGVFAAMALWEVLAPRRRQATGRLGRWPGILGVVAIDTLVVRLLFPTAAVGMALLAEERGWGLFAAVPTPGWLAIVVSVVLLDLTIYFQHVLFHAVPVLWRLHRMHHADLEFDTTTGVRFHPVEILLSMLLIGGELAQSRIGLHNALTGVFQGLLLFLLLACDTLIAHRVRWQGRRALSGMAVQ